MSETDRAPPPGLEPLSRHPQDGWQLADPYPMRPATRRAFRSVIRALLPPQPALPGIEEEVEDGVRRLLRYMQPLVAWLFCVLVHVLDWAPLWRLRSWHRLRSLSQPRASDLLDAMAHSRVALIRTLLVGAKGAILSTYFDLSRVHEQMNYDARPFMLGRIALRQRLRSGGQPTDADLIGPGRGGLP